MIAATVRRIVVFCLLLLAVPAGTAGQEPDSGAGETLPPDEAGWVTGQVIEASGGSRL